MNLLDALNQHHVEVLTVLTTQNVIYRIDNDLSGEIEENQGFLHRPSKANKSAGIGGIYFWIDLESALKYAAADQSSVLYAAARPVTNVETHQFSFDYFMSRRNKPVVNDTVLLGVDTYLFKGKPDSRNEYVKAGNVGDWFKPVDLAKLSIMLNAEEQDKQSHLT